MDYETQSPTFEGIIPAKCTRVGELACIELEIPQCVFDKYLKTIKILVIDDEVKSIMSVKRIISPPSLPVTKD